MTRRIYADCPYCTWTNIYMTCQDGSREYAAYQHAQTHEAAAHSAENDRPRGQRYSSPVAQERMSNYLCPECGYPPSNHSSDNRFWVPRQCDLTRVGVQERIAAYEWDTRVLPPAAADPVLAFVERVEGRLEAMSADAPGYYDDVIRVLRDEAQTRVTSPVADQGGSDA